MSNETIYSEDEIRHQQLLIKLAETVVNRVAKGGPTVDEKELLLNHHPFILMNGKLHEPESMAEIVYFGLKQDPPWKESLEHYNEAILYLDRHKSDHDIQVNGEAI
jgi:hypothetical protein